MMAMLKAWKSVKERYLRRFEELMIVTDVVVSVKDQIDLVWISEFIQTFEVWIPTVSGQIWTCNSNTYHLLIYTNHSKQVLKLGSLLGGPLQSSWEKYRKLLPLILVMYTRRGGSLYDKATLLSILIHQDWEEHDVPFHRVLNLNIMLANEEPGERQFSKLASYTQSAGTSLNIKNLNHKFRKQGVTKMVEKETIVKVKRRKKKRTEYDIRDRDSSESDMRLQEVRSYADAFTNMIESTVKYELHVNPNETNIPPSREMSEIQTPHKGERGISGTSMEVLETAWTDYLKDNFNEKKVRKERLKMEGFSNQPIQMPKNWKAFFAYE